MLEEVTGYIDASHRANFIIITRQLFIKSVSIPP